MDKSSVKALTDKSECSEAVQQLINSSERVIAIFSQQLEPLLYNHRIVCEQVSQLARKNQYTQVRIIAQQTRSAASSGHCLIQLAQKLSSYVQIRTPNTPELQKFSQSWLIIDDHSMCEISDPERYEGKLIEHDRIYVKKQLDFFDHAWEHSVPDINTRRLSI
jgi:hypothetical protein